MVAQRKTLLAIIRVTIVLVPMLAAASALEQSNATQQLELNSHTRILVLSPKAAARANETHAALIISNASFSGDFTFRGRVRTVKQLRTGSDPNPWECAWVVWNYYRGHFYYLALKPNGWEIGKHDRSLTNQQAFLKTGKTEFAIGTWHEFEIAQRQNEIRVAIDGVETAAFEDATQPYTSGKLGFYTEDAEIQIGDISAPFKDDFESYPLGMIRGDGHVIKHWSMPFLGHGFAAIAAIKK